MPGHAEHPGTRRGKRWRLAGWSAAALLLLLPAMAMRFTDAVAWGPGDFLLAGALVGGVGLGFELAVKRSGNRAYRAGAALALATGFALVWANAAVGIVGSEDEAVNGLFYGVAAVGLAGAALAQFRARGMAWAMLVTAVAHLIAVEIAATTAPGIEPAVFVFVGLGLGRRGCSGRRGAAALVARGRIRFGLMGGEVFGDDCFAAEGVIRSWSAELQKLATRRHCTKASKMILHL